MNNLFVYCEIEDGIVADVSLELLTKGRSLATRLGCRLEAIAAGTKLDGIGAQVFPYGVDVLHVFDDPRLFPYTSLPHTSILVNLFTEEKPQIALMGATSIGRDLGPRVSSALTSGLTADCTSLEIGDHEEKKENKVYKDLLYQIRPAFGGNIVAWIINPECRPQMATVREGVMKKEILNPSYNFELLHKLAAVLGGEVGASRAAVDAGFTDHDRQIGQTGVTVRPKLYIACGISGQIQHIAGMQESAMIISINNDPNAPINTIADYVINGTIEEVIPKMIKYYKKNSK